MSTSSPRAIVTAPVRRCKVCRTAGLGDWISDSLRLTLEGGHPRPTVRAILEAVHGEPGLQAADISVYNLREHLKFHDEHWNEWTSASP